MALSRPEPLEARHVLTEFNCGQASLNDWLSNHARQSQSVGSGRTFVVSENNLV
jgi:hypothetical protein